MNTTFIDILLGLVKRNERSIDSKNITTFMVREATNEDVHYPVRNSRNGPVVVPRPVPARRAEREKTMNDAIAALARLCHGFHRLLWWTMGAGLIAGTAIAYWFLRGKDD